MRKSIEGLTLVGGPLARRQHALSVLAIRAKQVSAALLSAPRGIIAGILLSAILWFGLISLLF